MSTFLKLVGMQTYASRTLGVIKHGQTIEVEDEDLAEALLEKGTLVGVTEDDPEGYLKPYFVEVAAPKPKRPARVQSAEEVEQASVNAEEELKRRLGAHAPQAPVGPGPNGAENADFPEDFESDEDGAADPAYHETNQGSEGVLKDNEVSDDPSDVENEAPAAAAPVAKPVTRQRAAKPATK